MKTFEPEKPVGRVAELFAGVGGFRLGLNKAGWKTVYSNQWEPSTKIQHASDVYKKNFGPEGHENIDIANVERIPAEFDLLVGGFPCQDYSVAKSLSSSTGLEGKKGVLWWEILRLVSLHKPKFVFLENVDRLLKSPSTQRGRDFAVMLSSLGNEGYTVEWRVVNAADYGFPQRRKRVFLIAHAEHGPISNLETVIRRGVLGEALPADISSPVSSGKIDSNLLEVSDNFGKGLKKSLFQSAGVFQDGQYLTADVKASWQGERLTLGDVLLDQDEVDPKLYIERDSIPKWEYLKGAKSEPRVTKDGFEWNYTEGSMSFPDPLDRPSRTLLTGEGGTSASRFKHVIEQGGRLRRLDAVEMERLSGFPDGWTKSTDTTDLPTPRRAFFMGNALVVGLVEMVGQALAKRMKK